MFAIKGQTLNSGTRFGMDDLLQIMARLRSPVGGCPWDVEQTFSTIAPYTIEEAYEVADAIERNAMDELRDELGDLLFQVVFHARMAEESSHFNFNDVVEAICDKMERRHPHVFGDAEVASEAEVRENSRSPDGERLAFLRFSRRRPVVEEGRDLVRPDPKSARIAVIDRNISLGREGIFCAEVKAALCNSPVKKQILGYLAGIGGTDVDVDLIQRIVLDALSRNELPDRPIWMKEE